MQPVLHSLQKNKIKCFMYFRNRKKRNVQTRCSKSLEGELPHGFFSARKANLT